jgi:predicted NBD/HSP70 family sugar kinase
MASISTHSDQNTPKRFMGVDTGGTKTKAAMIEIDGTLPRLVDASIVELDSDVARGPQHVIGTVIPETIAQSLEKVGLEHRDIGAFGFDFPCPVSDDGVTLSVGNMRHPAWRGFHVKSELVSSIGRADPYRTRLVCVDNDAAATMFGVAQQLPPEEREKIIMGLFVGTGLGGAITMGGRNPFKNESGGSEPGASTVFFDEDRFLFGAPGDAQHRRLEEFVSLIGIERQLQKMYERGVIPSDHPLLALEGKGDKSEWRVRAEGLLRYANEALKNGNMDDFSVRVFEAQRNALGLYVQQMVQVLRIDHIFLGGGIADSARVTDEFRTWYLDGVKEIARSFVYQQDRQEKGFPEFHSPLDGDAAAPFGAAIMAWKASIGSGC